MSKKKNPHIGSTLDEFLKDEGVLEGLQTQAIKGVVAWQLAEAMKARGVSKLVWRNCCIPAVRKSIVYLIPRAT